MNYLRKTGLLCEFGRFLLLVLYCGFSEFKTWDGIDWYRWGPESCQGPYVMQVCFFDPWNNLADDINIIKLLNVFPTSRFRSIFSMVTVSGSFSYEFLTNINLNFLS